MLSLIHSDNMCLNLTILNRLYEERISEIDAEIRLVNEGTHPELVAMMEAVNKRRDDKIRLYNTQLRYALQSQHTTMTATRAQLHSQYSQQVREIRERYLDRVSEGLYQIQRERRASDMLVQGKLARFDGVTLAYISISQITPIEYLTIKPHEYEKGKLTIWKFRSYPGSPSTLASRQHLKLRVQRLTRCNRIWRQWEYVRSSFVDTALYGCSIRDLLTYLNYRLYHESHFGGQAWVVEWKITRSRKDPLGEIGLPHRHHRRIYHRCIITTITTTIHMPTITIYPIQNSQCHKDVLRGYRRPFKTQLHTCHQAPKYHYQLSYRTLGLLRWSKQYIHPQGYTHRQ